MLKVLQNCLKVSRNFDDLVDYMRRCGYRVTLSQNVKDGVSGMRIVKLSDINDQTQRQYHPGYKLSEITNKLKIKDIKEILNRNAENHHLAIFTQSNPQTNEIKHPEKSALREIESAMKELLKPSYAPAADDELLRKRKRRR